MSPSKKNPLKFRKALMLTLILVFISPIFGVILADMVGYHEPLDVVAESLNLPDLTNVINWTPFLDYTMPGLSAEIGYIIAGIIGISIILVIGIIINSVVKHR